MEKKESCCISSECDYTDISKLMLRFTVGFLLLFHGMAKINYGISFIEELLASKGLPTIIAYGSYIGEIVAPIMLIIGFRVRIASIIIFFTLIMAVFLGHLDDFFTLSEVGAWAMEVQIFYLMGSLAIFLQGAGKYSIDGCTKNK
ncbi:DoxX family protein [Arcobacter sp.]|uniref:DoxX family protein n=1 Tax=unclassified Arcobacter TaxID=2593671 RepID=UPI003B005A82